MPYVAEENKILTKVLGVATKSDSEDQNDKSKVRQVVLTEMHDEPEKVDYLYLKKNDVYVCINDNHFHLGYIKSKYDSVIMQNVTKITRWQITGGYDLPTKQVLIAGEQTPLHGHRLRAHYGLNICIDII